MQIGDTLELPSIDVSIQFVDFAIGIPDYSDITVDVQYIFIVNLPNDRSCEECFLWLDEFQINGTPVEYQVGTYSWNEFQPVSPDYLETETMAFAVTYESTYTDLSYTMHCAASEALDITFISDQSFWDVVNVDSNNTVTDYQAKLDLQNGIFTYDLTESDESDFEIDGWYKLTGRVLYSGKYMGELTDDYQICFSMAEASWWPQYYCYFTEEAWNRLPDLSSGDIVTLYGRYDYVAIVGYNFHDCTIESPAGTFVLNDAGEAEVIPFGLLDEDDATSVSSPPDYSYEGGQTNDYVNILGKYEHESNGCVVTLNEFTGEGGGYTIDFFLSEESYQTNDIFDSDLEGTFYYMNGMEEFSFIVDGYDTCLYFYMTGDDTAEIRVLNNEWETIGENEIPVNLIEGTWYRTEEYQSLV